MVEYLPIVDDSQEEERLDRTFHALSHQVRRKLMRRLTDGSARVTDLARDFDFSLNAISKHLKVLEEAGLVERSREGRVHRMGLDVRPLEPAAEVIAFYRQFWSERLDALAEIFTKVQEVKSLVYHQKNLENENHER